MTSKVDVLYRSLLKTRFFNEGWGSPRVLQTLYDLKKHFINKTNIENFIRDADTVEITNICHTPNYQLMTGEFVTPLCQRYPFLVPKASHIARFEMILPITWKYPNHKPVCIHLACTGDHFYWRRRRFMAQPLLKKADIGAIILENPFYGTRKPKRQKRSNLLFVSDIFVMGACLILECLVLLKWCEKQGFGPLGISGISMGGHMATLAASAWPKPLVLVPCLSWTTASTVFTTGVMSKSVDWATLTVQYYNTPEIRNLIREKGSPIAKINKTVDSSLTASFALYMYFASFLFRNENSMSLTDWRDKSVVNYMRLIMDEFTDLRNFPPLVDPSLCIVLSARHDAYVPREGCADFCDIWKGSDVRYLHTGHVLGIIFYHDQFQSCIIEAFERARKKREMTTTTSSQKTN